MEARKWTKIGQLANLVADANWSTAETFQVTYRGKIKLHGTNASVRYICDGSIFVQSRNAIVKLAGTPGPGDESTHYGFTKVGLSWTDLPACMTDKDDVVVFGEWCGPGVQKGVASAQVDEKFFAIFALDSCTNGVWETVIDPDEISALLGPKWLSKQDVHVLPFHTEAKTVDLKNADELEKFRAWAASFVQEVEVADPWVKEVFGKEGVGEGLVFYPIEFDFAWEKSLLFKAKGEKHSVTKVRKIVDIDPLILEKKQELVDAIVTDNRLNQGLDEVFGEQQPVINRMSDFIRWVMNDVQTECMLEIESSGFEWTEVAKPISTKAAQFLKGKLL